MIGVEHIDEETADAGDLQRKRSEGIHGATRGSGPASLPLLVRETDYPNEDRWRALWPRCVDQASSRVALDEFSVCPRHRWTLLLYRDASLSKNVKRSGFIIQILEQDCRRWPASYVDVLNGTINLHTVGLQNLQCLSKRGFELPFF